MKKILILFFLTSSVLFAESISKFKIPSMEKINIVGKFGNGEKSCGRILPFGHSISNCKGKFCNYLRNGFFRIESSKYSYGDQNIIILGFKDIIETERKFREGFFIKAIEGTLIDRAQGNLDFFDDGEKDYIFYDNSPIIEIEKIYWEEDRWKCAEAKAYWDQVENYILKLKGTLVKKVFRHKEKIELTIEIENISEQDVSLKNIYFNGLSISSNEDLLENKDGTYSLGIHTTMKMCENPLGQSLLKSKEKIKFGTDVSFLLRDYTKEKIFGKGLIRNPAKFKVGFRINLKGHEDFLGKEVKFELRQ
ncbi:MAG: hypothetical protein IPQ05_20405 [Leptospiraceae bacterium]|nr:hypothetical protein [Leptospiraceae bacterium]MBL0266159.1 hypothetical protein [Leptospiraceae bacterium]